eukprot:tig00001094_g7009.t1
MDLLAGYGSDDDNEKEQQEAEEQEEQPSGPRGVPPPPSALPGVPKFGSLFGGSSSSAAAAPVEAPAAKAKAAKGGFNADIFDAPAGKSASESGLGLFDLMPAPKASGDGLGLPPPKKGKKKKRAAFLVPIDMEALKEDDDEDEKPKKQQEAPAPSEEPSALGWLPAPKRSKPAPAPPSDSASASSSSKPADKPKLAPPGLPAGFFDSDSAGPSGAAGESDEGPAQGPQGPSPPPGEYSDVTEPYPSAVGPYPGAESGSDGEATGAYMDPESYAAYLAAWQAEHGEGSVPGFSEVPSYEEMLHSTGLAGALPEGAEVDENLRRELEKSAKRGKGLGVREVNAEAVRNDPTLASWAFHHKKKAPVFQTGRTMFRPDMTSRRKHQITFLAYDVQQRAAELEEKRSQCKLTKSQTWGKYGW